MTDTTTLPTDLLEDLIAAVEQKLADEASRHYDNVIFSPDYSGQTPLEKYTATHGKDDDALITRARNALYA